jgi:hypothetical protein
MEECTEEEFVETLLWGEVGDHRRRGRCRMKCWRREKEQE